MEKLKYKVGDTVFIKGDLKEGATDFGNRKCAVDSQMIRYSGRKAIIKVVRNESSFQFSGYVLDIDNGHWRWQDFMLESTQGRDYTVKKIVTGNKVIVLLYYKDNKGTKKFTRGIAKCNPEDEFDEVMGVSLAFQRAYKKYLNEQ